MKDLIEPMDDNELADWEIDLEQCTEVIIKLTINTHTYGEVEGIMEEVGDSFEWMRYDHQIVLRGQWEQA